MTVPMSRDLECHWDMVDTMPDSWVGLSCPMCQMEEAVIVCWNSPSDSYEACCFNCAQQFELDWDEYGGDTLMATIWGVKA